MSARIASRPVGVIATISVTAIKGFGMCAAKTIAADATGARGNRDFFLIDGDDRLLSVTRTAAFLSYWSELVGDTLVVGRDGTEAGRVVAAEPVRLGGPVRAHFFLDRYVEGHLVLGDWNELFSAIADQQVRLVRAATPAGGNDLHPVSLCSSASVAALGVERDGSPLDPRRFRLLLELSGPAAFEEDTWRGQELLTGSLRLRLGGPVQRCAAIQHDPRDGSRGTNALRLIHQCRGVQHSELGRGLNLGMYAEVLQSGATSVGAPVILA